MEKSEFDWKFLLCGWKLQDTNTIKERKRALITEKSFAETYFEGLSIQKKLKRSWDKKKKKKRLIKVMTEASKESDRVIVIELSFAFVM